jgi:hypothetical protein
MFGSKVNRIIKNPNKKQFAACSADGSIEIVDYSDAL